MTPAEIEQVARELHSRYLSRSSSNPPDPDETWDYILTDRVRDDYRDDARAVVRLVDSLRRSNEAAVNSNNPEKRPSLWDALLHEEK